MMMNHHHRHGHRRHVLLPGQDFTTARRYLEILRVGVQSARMAAQARVVGCMMAVGMLFIAMSRV